MIFQAVQPKSIKEAGEEFLTDLVSPVLMQQRQA